MIAIHFNLTAFCGNPNNIFWNGDAHNFGICFQKFLFSGVSFSILAILSAFYVGKSYPSVVRNQKQKLLISFRLIIVLLSLMLSILHPCLLYYLAEVQLYWVDALSSLVQILAWILHLKYLAILRCHLSSTTRGPKAIIFAWVLTLLYHLLYCKTVWNRPPDPIRNPVNGNLILYLLRGLLTSELVMQILYFFTLFPKGQIDLYESQEFSERTPLLGGRINHSNYTRLNSTFDQYELGLAEVGCNKLSYMTFYWANALLEKGSLGRLESVDDLYQLPPQLQTVTVSQKVQNTMMLSQPLSSSDTESNIPRKYSLLRSLHQCFGIPFYLIGLLKLLGDSLGFAGPLLLHELVLFVEKKENTYWKGYAAALGICVASLLGSLCTVHYNYLIAKINVQLRAALITTIFRKIQRLNGSKMSKFTTGEIVNFMSTDTDRVINFCKSFHSFWSLPLQLAFTLYLLYRQIGVAFLSGLVFALLLIPINRLLAIKIGHLSKRMMHFKDRRVHLMTEALEMIKAIKLNAWENIFKRKIMDERFGEVKALAGRKYLDAACVYFWAATPVLIPIAAFGTFVAIGNKMEPAKVFTAVALFNMLIMPLNAFPWVINGLVEAWVSIKRIEKLMQAEDHVLNNYYTMVPEMSQKGSDLQVVMINASFSWSSDRMNQQSNSSSQEFRTVSPRSELGSCSPQMLDDQDECAVAFMPQQTVKPKRSHRPNRSSSSAIETVSASQMNNVFSLKDLNVEIKKNQLLGIVGNVGSGKTAFLNAIVGEMEKINGVVSVANLHQGFGFAPQKPWLQNMSIRDNIIFGQSFDPERYRSVIHSCALEEDFRTLVKGEHTKCGENGASLSGGQRARVALARTVYQNKNIYLLDDVLSAVDYSVANQIVRRLIHRFLIGKTVILVTHHLHLLARADSIIHLENGAILRQGPPKEILSRLGLDITDEEMDGGGKLSGAVPRLKLKQDLSSINLKCPEYCPEETEDAEGRAYGGLSGSVYSTYLSAVGGTLVLAIFFSIVLMQTARNLTDTWLAQWVTSVILPINQTSLQTPLWVPLSRSTPLISEFSEIFPDATRQMFNYHSNYARIGTEESEIMLGSMDPSTKFYLSVYGLLAASHSVFTLARAFLFAYGGICAAKILHAKLLDAVLNTKIGFFDLNPAGRILNRFSTDIYTTDDTLPFQTNIFFAQLFGLLGSLIVTVYGMPWILLLYVPLMFVYYTIQDYYRHTSRDLRRIYALSMSPLYNHFIETINGLPVIRALRAGHRFGAFGDAYLEKNQRAQFCLEIVSQWLNFRLQLLGVGILGGVVLLSLWQHHFSGINAGLVGLVISYALTINGFLNGVVTSLTETERELISVERLQQYLQGAEREGEGELVNPLLALPLGWPSTSTIKMQNVYLKYHAHNPYSLRNVNLEIGSCEKVGIVGRTGAGKSSLFVALFRLVKLSRGRIFIDCVDITDLSIKKLRANLAIISQDVLLFSGTVRENLDPKGQNSDDNICGVIGQCHLNDIVDQLGGLDGNLAIAGRNLSAGQRQLFCFARALLGRTKIVCIDEGSSSLDYEMDLRIQNLMRDAFSNKTVLIIAHRIHTIKNCDKVIVMDDGEIIEIGRPNELMENPNSAFHSIFH